MQTGDQTWHQGPSILASAWRYRWLVLAAAVIGFVVGLLLSSQRPTVYEAEARMFLGDPRAGGLVEGRSVDPERYVPQQAERVTAVPVLEQTAELLGGDVRPSDLGDRIRAEGDVELDLITIVGSASTGEEAAELANVAAEAYQQVTQELRLDAATRAADELRDAAGTLDEQIETLQGQIDPEATLDDGTRQQLEVLIRQRVDMTTRAQQLIVDARVFGSGVELVEPAEIPTSRSSPQPLRDAILAAMLLAAIATAIAYRRAGSLRVVQDKRDPAPILEAPLLGTIPLRPGRQGETLEARLDLGPESQEAYHLVLASLLHELGKHDARSVLVTSAQAGDGKTEVALQLAVAAIVEHRRVLLADGDLRARRLSIMTDLAHEPGVVDLTDAGSDEERLSRVVRRVPIFGGNMQLPMLPTGPESARRVGVLRSPEWSRSLRSLGRAFDLTFVDSAPLLLAADTSVLAGHVDALVLVVREGVDLSVLEQVRERLSFTGAQVAGYVYVGRDRDASPQSGSYAYARDRREEVVSDDAGAAPAVPASAGAGTGEHLEAMSDVTSGGSASGGSPPERPFRPRVADGPAEEHLYDNGTVLRYPATGPITSPFPSPSASGRGRGSGDASSDRDH